MSETGIDVFNALMVEVNSGVDSLIKEDADKDKRIAELEKALEEIVEVEEVTIPADYVFNIARQALKGGGNGA